MSESTLKQFGDTFEVEPGDGASRDNYLKEHNIVTYFIIEKVSLFLVLFGSFCYLTET